MGNTKNQYRGGEDYLKGSVGQFEGLREGGLGKKEKVVFLGGWVDTPAQYTNTHSDYVILI